MKYEIQLKMLEYLASNLSREPRALPTILAALERWFGTVQPRPDSFAPWIDGAMRRGWIAKRSDGLYVGTGQLWMFVRNLWSGEAMAEAFNDLRTKIDILLDDVVQRPADTLLDMDGFAPTLTPEQRELAWASVLAAAPGLAAQVTSPRDPHANPSSRIRLAASMLDKDLLLRMVDIARDAPHPVAMPIDVSP